MYLFIDHSHWSTRGRDHTGLSLFVRGNIVVAEELLWSVGSLLPDTPYLPRTIQGRQLVTTQLMLALYVTGEKDSVTSGPELESKSSVGAEAIRSEANADLAGVGEEGRRGRLLPTKWSQIPRRGVDLEISARVFQSGLMGLARGFFFFMWKRVKQWRKSQSQKHFLYQQWVSIHVRTTKNSNLDLADCTK